ncbi:MAG: AAA family ATPase [Planctomycetota bacterium]
MDTNARADVSKADMADAYTPEVCQVLDDLQEWIDRDPEARSITGVAHAIHVHHSTLSRTLKRTYDGRVDRIAGKVERFLDHDRDRRRAPKRPDYVHTSITERVLEVLYETHLEGDMMGAIIGPTGVGKTMACRHYQEAEPETIYMVAGPACTKTALLRELCRQLEIEWPRGNYIARQALVEKLSGSQRLVIIDEIDYVREEMLQELRLVNDEATQCGFAIVGTESFIQKLRERHSTTINQVLGRIGPTARLSQISEDDLAQIARCYEMEDGALDALCKGAHGQGRRAVTALVAASRMTGGDGPIAERHIRKAYQGLMPVTNGIPHIK